MPALKIEFVGLCAYLFSDKQGKNATTLLVKHDHHPHEPQLLVNLTDLSDPADEKWFKGVGNKIGLLDLTDYEMLIRPDGTTNSDQLKANDLDKKKKGCPGLDKDDLSWLVDLNGLTGKPSRKDLTGKNPPSVVSSRVFLTEGDFDCIGHAAGVGQIRQYQFDSEEKRAIADATRCTVKNHKTAAFEVVPIRGNNSRISFTLKLPAEVLISNSAATGTGGTVFHHFSAFYQLLDPPPSPEPTMVDAGGCTKGDAGLTLDFWVSPIPPSPPRRPCPQSMLYQ